MLLNKTNARTSQTHRGLCAGGADDTSKVVMVIIIRVYACTSSTCVTISLLLKLLFTKYIDAYIYLYGFISWFVSVAEYSWKYSSQSVDESDMICFLPWPFSIPKIYASRYLNFIFCHVVASF